MDGKCVQADPFLQEHTIETTGAGDTFCACVIGFVLEHGLDNLAEADLKSMLSFANAAASIVTTRKGAIRSMPEKEEIDALRSEGEQEQAETQFKSFEVMLRSVDLVKNFVNDMGKIEGNVFLSVGRYVIDAKSIMGIFSLELSKPLKLEIEKWKDEYAVILEKYVDK